jgi:hypothetical protein
MLIALAPLAQNVLYGSVLAVLVLSVLHLALTSRELLLSSADFCTQWLSEFVRLRVILRHVPQMAAGGMFEKSISE